MPGYRGPSGRVPPNEQPPGSPAPGAPTPSANPTPTPTPGATPAPTPAPSPTPSATPAGAGRGGAATGAQGGVTRRVRSRRAASFEDWDFWWAYNKDGYLNLKANLYDRGSRNESESAAFFFGRQKKKVRRNKDRPTPEFARKHLLPRLLEALESEDSEARESACLALGKIGDAGEVGLLAESKNLPMLHLRATIGLGLMGAREFIPALVRSLGSESSCYMLCSKARALGYIGDRTAVPALLNMVSDPDAQASIRGFAIQALGNIADPEPWPLVSRITTNHNYLASTECLNALLATL